MIKTVERLFAGRDYRMETGRMGRQAAGCAVVQHGDTTVLAAVLIDEKETHLDFFPMIVEYREKAYAAGVIPKGFFKREGRPSSEEILAGRLITEHIHARRSRYCIFPS